MTPSWQGGSYPTDAWLTYVTSTEASCCWFAEASAKGVIAALQVDREGERGYLDIAIRPDLRGQRLGIAVLSAFIAGPGNQYQVLEGAIEPDNAASLVCVCRCDFRILPGLNDDGLIRVERNRDASSGCDSVEAWSGPQEDGQPSPID